MDSLTWRQVWSRPGKILMYHSLDACSPLFMFIEPHVLLIRTCSTSVSLYLWGVLIHARSPLVALVQSHVMSIPARLTFI